MTERAHIQVRGANVYASHEDFHTIFNEDLKELCQLSCRLTRDPSKAERCLASGLEDITRNTTVLFSSGAPMETFGRVVLAL
jgi:hypothetical protein